MTNAVQTALIAISSTHFVALTTLGYGKPSLLSFSEVHELLRNTGSILIHLLSSNEWADLCGKTGVEWDALDVAPNFMTHWLHTPGLVSALASHWSSNEELSPRVVEQLCTSRQHLAGYELCCELYKAAFDIAFYSEYGISLLLSYKSHFVLD